MTRAKSRASSETFTALNGLRFVAAMAVVFFHYAPKTDSYPHPGLGIGKLINNGPAAVSFFFILSGFVLGHRYLPTGIANTINSGSFFKNRLARLYPAYITGFCLFAPLALEKYILHPRGVENGPHTFIFSSLLSLFMVQAWTPFAQSWNGPSWSLSVEAFMYLIFPAVGSKLVNLEKVRMAVALCVLWLLPVSLASAYVCGIISAHTWHRYIANNPLLWTPLFFMGICASGFVSRWNSTSKKVAAALSSATFIAIALLAASWPTAWSEVFVTGGIAPLFLALVVFFTRRLGWIAKILGGGLFNELGKASYVIYIIQAPLWHYWQALVRVLVLRTPTNSFIAANCEFYFYIPILIGVSCLVPRFIETPFHRWLLRTGKPQVDGNEHTGIQVKRPVELGVV